MTYLQTGLPRRAVATSQRRSRFLRIAGLMMCVALPTLAHAEQADRNKPLIYAADHLSYDDLTQTTILTGNVEITKGTIIVRGDRAEVKQSPEGYSYATATRETGLAYIRQKREGVNEYFEGYGKKIDYDGKNDVSVLIGQAVARRLQGLTTVIDEVHGTTIRYDGQSGFYTATSGSEKGIPSSGRVRGMIAPTVAAPSPSPTPTSAPAPTRNTSADPAPSNAVPPGGAAPVVPLTPLAPPVRVKPSTTVPKNDPSPDTVTPSTRLESTE